MPKTAPPGAVATAARRLERLIAAEARRPSAIDEKLGAPPAALVIHGDSPEALAAARVEALAPYQGAEHLPQVIEVRHVTLTFPDPPPAPMPRLASGHAL